MTAIRFAVTGTVPVKATHGILLADEAHRLAGHELTRAGLDNPRRQEILGSNGAATYHRHAHWIPLGIPGHEPPFVRSLIVWVPRGLRTEDVAALLSLRGMSGRRGSREDGYDVRGLPPVELLFQAAGQFRQVAPELCGPPARRWRSLTPYLPCGTVSASRWRTADDLRVDLAGEAEPGRRLPGPRARRLT